QKWLNRLQGERALRKGQTQTNRAPVRDVEVSVVILEQGVHAAVEIAEAVGVLPADAGHVGAAGTTPGIPQAFVRNRSVAGREFVILILTHGYAFSQQARRLAPGVEDVSKPVSGKALCGETTNRFVKKCFVLPSSAGCAL